MWSHCHPAGLGTFVFVHLLFHILWALYNWLGAVVWSLINIARGLTDLFVSGPQPTKPCTLSSGAAGGGTMSGGGEKEPAAVPMPWEGPVGAVSCTLLPTGDGQAGSGQPPVQRGQSLAGRAGALRGSRVHPESGAAGGKRTAGEQAWKNVFQDAR